MAGEDASDCDRESIEWAKCDADAAYFLDNFGVIDDAQGHGDGSGRMPFKLWPDQVSVLWTLMTARLVLILKARQLGISWICCGYALWLAFFQGGKVVLLFSMGEVEAIEMLRRIKALYYRLPQWMRDRGPAVDLENMTQFGWDNGSRILSLPSGENSGSSLTASLAILDEAAKLKFAESLYTALKPTIDNGGQLIVLSTAKGVGNFFHQLWTKAAAGLNRYQTIFLPWWARPGRTAEWFANQIAEAIDPALVKQEYPANANEAFVSSGRNRFHGEWISAQAPHVRAGLDAGKLPESLRAIPGLTVYELPPDPKANLRKRSLLIGADVAEGLEDGDYSHGVLIDAETREEIACVHGHWEPDEFGKHLHKLAKVYDAAIAVERNNHGFAVLTALKALDAQKVIHAQDGRRGWLTNTKTKPQAVDELAAALRDGVLVIHSQATLDELQVYQVLADGGTGSPCGYHDDRVMAWAIALACLKLGLHRQTPKRYF